MISQLKGKNTIALLMIILLAAALRFYNINWGDGYHFHPDERNIAQAVSNLDLGRGKFNPEFWAYGSLPIYLIYIIGWILQNFIPNIHINFDSYIIIGRVLSSCASLVVVYLTYLTTKNLIPDNKNSPLPLIACLWVAFSPGMIQYAHFTTFETFLTLQYLVLGIILFKLSESGQTKNYIWAGIIFGLSIGTKITTITLLPILWVTHLIYVSKASQNIYKSLLAPRFIISHLLIVVFAFLASPYNILDWTGFRNSFNYESGVASGSLPVFYTQQFNGTIPVIYQLTKVFPYILTIPLTILCFLALIHFSIFFIIRFLRNFKNRTSIFTLDQANILILTIFTIDYLAFNFTLFVKWTRYMVPVIPFLIILGVAYINYSHQLLPRILNNLNFRRNLLGVLSAYIMLSGIIFWQIYRQPDNRVASAQWANHYIPSNSIFTSEVYDLGIMPFNQYFHPQNIHLLNIYDLDSGRPVEETISTLQESDYFISLSSRIYQTRMQLPADYPNGYYFYRTIFNPKGSWQMIGRFSNTQYDCHILNFNCMGGKWLPDETFYVFDHPTVLIYKNTYAP